MRGWRKRLIGGLLAWAWAATAAAAPPGQATSTDFHGAGMPIATQPLQMALRGARVSRLKYWTADPLRSGRLIAASALVFLPQGTAPADGWPVLAWDHGTSGLAEACAPSRQGYSPDKATFLQNWIAAGFAIVAPDYIGMGEPGPNLYLNAQAEGAATLDALRAALRAVPGLRNDIVINGHSQGGQAALAAGALAPSYAPDLKVLGTIAMAPPYLDGAALQALQQPPVRDADGASSVVYSLLLAGAWQEAHPTAEVAKAFTPRAARYLRMAHSLCLGPLYRQVAAAGLNPGNAFTAQARPLLASIAVWASYPSLHLPAPLFIAIGSADRQISPASQLRLARAACTAGSQVALHLYPGLDHAPVRDGSQTDAIVFARQLLAHAPVTTSCPIAGGLSVDGP